MRTAELWQAALSTLNPNPTDSCPLYLNCATVAALPPRVSRHNSPSAAHFVTRLVRTCLPPGTHRCIVMVCERSDAFASACALARAFPLFTHRAGASRRTDKTVTVEFFLVGQDNGPVEVSTLQPTKIELDPNDHASLAPGGPSELEPTVQQPPEPEV
ncbi:Putative aminopeptidase NPEPL1 [Pteropus alecto]|uniref:Putative aminopeptidase NPEPL1 n=1 Tax=Pteropus alecto TaxID=9402 RepID=L5JYD5_PTEAL|nr:Putative aminopeptidase NPEPL1 [Pteropus alecto]